MDFDTRGRSVLITGAAGGLGHLFARRAAQEGAAHVILWDIDESALASVADQVRSIGAQAHPYVIDVTDLDAIERTAMAVRADVGPVDVLINNAGVIRGKMFWEHDSARDTKLIMEVNALAPMYVTRAFLEEMITNTERPRRILTVSSAAALVSNPRMSVYAASKWAAMAWSDSLRLELVQAGHDHMAVTTFCPTYVDTGMFAGAGGMLLTRTLKPEAAVNHAWKAMCAGQAVLIKPWTAHLGKILRGVLPVRAWDAAAGGVLGIYHSMDRFTGRPS
jgi:all-trans-retinol dehydrogenase (NAD+)